MRYKRSLGGVCLIVGLAVVLGCVNVEVTEETQGEQMANTVLKDYDTLSNRWMVSSLRKSGDEVNLTPTEQRVVQAMNGRVADSDMVNEYKSAGYFGEGINGLLKMKNSPKDNLLLEKVKDVMKRENMNRKSIMTGIIEFDPELNKNHVPVVEQTFANKFAEESDSGVWLENADGSWRVKP